MLDNLKNYADKAEKNTNFIVRLDSEYLHKLKEIKKNTNINRNSKLFRAMIDLLYQQVIKNQQNE